MSTITVEIPHFTRGPLIDGRADWRASEMGDMSRWAHVSSFIFLTNRLHQTPTASGIRA